MQANWNIKSRAHECSRSGRAFEEGERFYTAIYFDTEAGEFQRRDVAEDVWTEEVAERKPFSYWKSEYVRPESGKPKVEIAGRESAEDLLRRFVEEDEEHTEHARYILALMLERKKQLVPKETKETEQGKTIIYEHRKSGEVFIIKDPELRLDELAMVQDEVAMLLGFGGPAAAAAAAVGMRITPDGKVENIEKDKDKGKKGRKGGKDEAPTVVAAPDVAETSAPGDSPDQGGAAASASEETSHVPGGEEKLELVEAVDESGELETGRDEDGETGVIDEGEALNPAGDDEDAPVSS